MDFPDESQRVAVLDAFNILDTPPEPIFDRLTQVAASICNTPISTVSLIDVNRQWFKSAIGLNISETDRAISFCTHAIRGRDPLIIPDTYRDPRFRDNPLVTASPYLRFYAGIPLITPEGFAIGTLTVMDRRPRRLDRAKIAALKLLADQVMTHIELRKQHNELTEVIAARDAINRQLQRQMDRLREAQRIALLGSWDMELDSMQLHLSEECFEIFGVLPRHDAVDFDAFLSSVHKDERISVRNAVESSIRGDTLLNMIHRIVRPGGEVRYVHERGERRTDGENCQVLAGTVQDITEQRKSHEQLDLLDTCISRVTDVVMITEAEPLDEPGPRIVFVNRAFEELTGYSIVEIVGKSPRILQGSKTQRTELNRIRHALLRKEHVTAELINYTKDGREFWVEIDIDPVATTSDKISHFVSIQRDITQRKATELEIERLAFFDHLTQLPNRRLLMDRLSHAIASAGRKSNCGALLFIDLDNFKNLNDTLGHDKGDQLLIQVARRLEGVVRKSNTIARLGGDEFVILLEDLSDEVRDAASQAEIVAEKALNSFRGTFQIGGHDYYCTASIGIALFSKQYNDADDLLKRADLAMYQAKASGRNSIRFFDQGMQAVVNTRVTLDREFRGSLQKGEFVLHYQPQVDQLGHVVGAEALVRWKHPRRGLMYPDEFISLAEDTGLIVRLGQWVLQSACKQLVLWKKQAETPTPNVSVNVSARQFHHPDFVIHTLGALTNAGVNPADVKLELTESAFVEQFDNTVEKMTELKNHGIRFSLDDFGTGYSSLSYLKELPLDEIKIDRAFVRDILTDAGDAAIAKTIVSLCHILGFDVVAEGVETEGQRTFLAEQGCFRYQGNLISPPLPPGEL